MRYRYRRRYDGPRLIETLTSYLLGWLALAIAVGLAVAIVVLAILLFASKPSLAEPITVPRPCIEIAKQYGMTAPEKMERSEIERHLNSVDVIAIGVLVPAVRRCRSELI